MSKLLIIETITWKPHIETAIEIAIRHRDAGDSLHYFNLRDGLPICEDTKLIHRLIDLPGIRVRSAHDLLRDLDGIEHHINKFTRAERHAARCKALALAKSSRSHEEFLNLSYEQFKDIGWGALSSAISVRRDSKIEYPGKKSLLLAYMASSILIYEKVIELIEKIKPDQILLFNGRFATTRPVMRAAERCGVPWLIHERGRDKDHYWMADYQPHNYLARQRDIVASWEPSKEEIAHEFFVDRRNRVEHEWHSFTKHQKVGKLPSVMSNSNEWITFFTSSDDELIAIGDEYRNQSFPTQLDAIRAVHRVVSQLPDLHLCIRVHPHLALKSRKDRLVWHRLKLPGAIVIGPADDIDSYALIDQSKIVACYGSTVGVEATYWRRPSMLLGCSFYDHLNVATIVKNEAEIRRFCESPKIHPMGGALKYGAFIRTFGERYMHYNAGSLHGGEILGRNLDDSPQMNLVKLIRNAFSRFTS